MNPEFKADFFKNALKLFLLMLCLCMLRPKMKTCETFPAAVHLSYGLSLCFYSRDRRKSRKVPIPVLRDQRPWQS